MFDVQKLLGQMLSGGMGGSRGKRKASSFGIPGVSNAQLGVGAIGLAIAAWEHFKTKPDAAASNSVGAPMPTSLPPPLPPTLPPPMPRALPASPAVDGVSDSVHLIRSMIAAANADRQIDAEERAAILERAMEAGLDGATQQYLMSELRAPASLEQIVNATKPELRLETFAAALIAIKLDTDAERDYLDRLAAGLGLTAQDRQLINEQLGIG